MHRATALTLRLEEYTPVNSGGLSLQAEHSQTSTALTTSHEEFMCFDNALQSLWMTFSISNQAGYLRKAGSQKTPPAICPGSAQRQIESGSAKTQVQGKLSQTLLFHVCILGFDQNVLPVSSL